MKLERMRLRNFRCYKDELSVEFGDLVMFVGRNDVGKSSIFEALNAFFGESKLDQDDASKDGDPKNVRIICEFSNFPKRIVLDKEHYTSLSDEFLLNSNGQLELHQVWDCSKKTPTFEMYAHARHPTAEMCVDLLYLKNAELKQRAKNIGADVSQVDVKINSELRAAIRRTVADLILRDIDIQLDKESGKKVWEQLKLSLPTFALFKADRPSTDTDPEAQDPMKAAMKEAFKSLEGKLNAIVEDVKKEVQETADRTVEKLKEMHPTLASQLQAKFSEPNWNTVLKVSLTGDNEIPLNKRGSGVRRLVLLNFFRAKAEFAAEERGDTVPVIYAIEEPETSQHPANQKLLLNALLELSESPGRQVFLTSHNPALARYVSSSCIRYVCDEGKSRSIMRVEGDVMKTALAADLGILPDHNVRLFIGVEGVNDINFLVGMSRMLLDNKISVPNLMDLEAQGKIIFIPCGGSNLALWASRLSHLNRPEFHLFDGDKEENKNNAAVKDGQPGCVGRCTLKREMENYLHSEAIFKVRPEIGRVEFGDMDDVPLLVAQAVHLSSGIVDEWDTLDQDKQKKKVSNAKRWLNRDAVQAMTPTLLSERDPAGEVLDWFRIIGENI